MFPFGLIQNRPAAKTRWGGPVNLRLLDGVLQSLAGLESGQLRSLDGDFLAGLGVAALACGALADLKGAEADQRDLVALLQGVGDGVQGAVDFLVRLASFATAAISSTFVIVFYLQSIISAKSGCGNFRPLGSLLSSLGFECFLR